MSRSQRPGGLTALAYINLVMILSFGFGLFIKLMQYITSKTELMKTYGTSANFFVNATANAAAVILFLLTTIGIFRASRGMALYGAATLMLILVAESALMLSMAPAAFDMLSVTALAYGLMLAGLMLTVFRRDFDSGRTHE